MLSENFPGLLELPAEQKRQVIRELCQALHFEANDGPADPELAAELNRLLEEYLADPSLGTPWDEAWERMEKRKAEWRAQRANK